MRPEVQLSASLRFRMENFRFDWKGSLAPERREGAVEIGCVDWKASLIPVQAVEAGVSASDRWM
ncbi:unnamed protein product [Effrenium voratum]|uniref:Uncharacterized protein n=1 Tax=Effrenium voratum TaxID=2562239 RepID=A0AA36IA21_9DINO|nr:unnamed protein product [Effrenium voratum]